MFIGDKGLINRNISMAGVVIESKSMSEYDVDIIIFFCKWYQFLLSAGAILYNLVIFIGDKGWIDRNVSMADVVWGPREGRGWKNLYILLIWGKEGVKPILT